MRALLLSLSLLLLAGCQSSQVTVDYDTAADFSTIKSYTWADDTNSVEEGFDPLMKQRIHKAVEAQLRAVPLSPAANPTQADVLVRYYVGTRTENQESRSRGSIGFGSGGGGTALGLALSFPLGGDKVVKEAQIVVDFLNPATKKLIWRGTNHLTIGDETPEEINALVDAAVAEMFAKYPPESTQ